MLEFLRTYGDLSPDYFYKGSNRSGYKVMPGAGEQAGVVRDPLDMHALLDADLWDGMLYEERFSWQATMFQPVGGMDRIPAAFEKRLERMIRFRCAVQQIRKSPDGVRVTYRDLKTGAQQSIDAHYCICTLPFSILKDLDTDLSPDLKRIIDSTTYDDAYKVAWESRRFWERDDSIYGGISFLNQPVSLVWYPSARLFSKKGVVIGGYGVESRTALAAMDLGAKLQASRQAIEHLHPGHSKELTKPVYVCWGRVPYNRGSWVHIEEPKMYPGYERAIQADDPIFAAAFTHIAGVCPLQGDIGARGRRCRLGLFFFSYFIAFDLRPVDGPLD